VILSMSGQAWLFLSAVLTGGAIGLLYDAFRVFRKTTPHSKLAVQIEDVVFWIAATGLTFYYMLHRNYGEIRPFVLVGIALGIVLYFATLSRLVLVVFVAIVEYMKKVVIVAVRIIMVPLRVVVAWLEPPLHKAYKATNKKARRVKLYGRNKLRKASQDIRILRKKV